VLVENAAHFFRTDGAAPTKEVGDFFAHLARLPDVLRANLYSGSRTIIWSSDASLVGRSFPDNPELEQALRGDLVAHGGERAKGEHAQLDTRFPYFLEIYAPVRDPASGEVTGVVELYKTPQPLFEAIAAGQRAVWLGAAVAGIFLYVALFWMVRRADNLIRAQRERLVQSETLAVVGEMSSAVAHGIRNPLASIRSSAELALESEPAEWRAAAQDIVAQVDRLESWVRELLSYSQPLAGKLEPVQLTALVGSSLQSFARELERRRIQVSSSIGTALPPINADASMLGHVFNSLIANALEAIEVDGHIAVSVEREGSGHVRVRIRDSGPGFADPQLANAFKLFHTTKPGGIGIGLPLARRIIQRFGGSIALTSERGAGTTVDVLLPAA
ncbi:MAG TPA: ATP-binding protein, partial [Burkholderiales bacterium]